MRPHATTTYVRAGPRAWALIRDAYLSGLSAPTVAARFGISVCALRKRARREGWTKAAAANGLIPRAPEPLGQPATRRLAALPSEAQVVRAHVIPLRIEGRELARQALARAAHALRDGEGLQALRLARAAQSIDKLNDRMDLMYDEGDTLPADDGRAALLREHVRGIVALLTARMLRGEPVPEEYGNVAAEVAEILAEEDANCASQKSATTA